MTRPEAQSPPDPEVSTDFLYNRGPTKCHRQRRLYRVAAQYSMGNRRTSREHQLTGQVTTEGVPPRPGWRPLNSTMP